MPRSNDAQVSSPGLRHKTAKQTDGRRRRGTKKTKRECWLTGKRGYKYFVEHHVMTVAEDPDLTVWLCRGSHYLVNLLSRYKIIEDPSKMADLIMLARTQAGFDNRRIVVRYEEVE